MGQEVRCTVHFGGNTAEGTALLETDHVTFRSDTIRLRIPFKQMRSVEAGEGDLRIESPEGTAVFALGPQAEKWAHKILKPKSLLDKLGVRAGTRVLVVGVKHEGFLGDLRERTDGVVSEEALYSARSFDTSGRAGRGVGAGTSGEGYDAVFVAVDGPADLDQLAALKRAIKPDGAVWAVFRKGRKHFNENDILRGGLDAGLVDVKVVRFSDTHTASKFVIRKSER